MGYVARQMLYGLADRGGYANKVLRTNPVAYWPLWEANGTIARCLVDNAQNGTYNSDVSTWPPGSGIGDGNTAPYFDGTNDSIDILTAALQSVFDGDTGTICAWCRVANVGMWSDFAAYHAISWKAPGNYSVQIYKRDVENAMGVRYVIGASTTSLGQLTTTTAWFHVAYVREAGVAPRFYFNKTQYIGPAPLGPWVGNLTSFYIGADDSDALRWNGWMQHVSFYDRALTQTEVNSLVNR